MKIKHNKVSCKQQTTKLNASGWILPLINTEEAQSFQFLSLDADIIRLNANDDLYPYKSCDNTNRKLCHDFHQARGLTKLTESYLGTHSNDYCNEIYKANRYTSWNVNRLIFFLKFPTGSVCQYLWRYPYNKLVLSAKLWYNESHTSAYCLLRPLMNCCVLSFLSLSSLRSWSSLSSGRSKYDLFLSDLSSLPLRLIGVTVNQWDNFEIM